MFLTIVVLLLLILSIALSGCRTIEVTKEVPVQAVFQGTVAEDYTTEQVGEVGIYSYIVHYMDSSKSGGFAYVINQYYVTPNEYYNLVGSVKKEKHLGNIGTSLATFKVLDGPIAAAATGQVELPAGEGQEDVVVEMDAGAAGTGEQGESVPAAPVDNDGNYTDDQLSDIWSTRTIYRNSDGAPIVITPDGNGNWVDAYGNSYWYESEEDVYDQNGLDYYWHGEAGDVAFMPVS